MNRFKSRFSLPIVLALLLLMLSNASLYAQGPGVQVGDKTVFGGSYVLASGERLKGSLTVFGGTAQIEQDATVEGDVAIMGGSAVVDGRITGDVAVFGGRLRLGPSAVIEGDLAAFGAVDRAPGARVLGSETSPNFRFALPGFGPGGPPPVVVGREGPGNFLLRLIWGLVKLVLTTIALGALGLIVALFLPRHTRNVAATASSAPAASAGVGCLTVPAAIAVSIILVITLIGIPVALVLWIVLVVAALFGWVGLGLFIGDRLLRMADVRSPRAAAAAAIGTALLTLVNNIFGFIPCIGGIVGLVLAAWGLGAVVLSRGGTQRYPAAAALGPGSPPIGPLDDEDWPSPPPASPARGADALWADLAVPTEPVDEEGEEPEGEPPPPPPSGDQPSGPPPTDEGNEQPE